MGDSDKDRDEDTEGRVESVAKQGKRKRRNASHADAIGFPKDKVVLKRVDTLINLVLNPPVESQPHPPFDVSARRKQTSIGDFTNGRDKFVVAAEGQMSGREKLPSTRQAKPGSGRGRGGRGRGRGSRGGSQGQGQGITHRSQAQGQGQGQGQGQSQGGLTTSGQGASHHNQAVPHNQGIIHSNQGILHGVAKEEPKQKSRISEYMIPDEEKRYVTPLVVRDKIGGRQRVGGGRCCAHLMFYYSVKQDVDDSSIFEKPLSPPSNLKYPSHNSPFTNDNLDRYSYTRPNIFNNDHELGDDSIAVQTHMLPHSHLPQLQFDPLPHTKLQNIQLPHEHSYTPNFPPLSQSYRQFHYTDSSKIIDNDTSNFMFDRQPPHKKLPVQLPPLFPPPPQLPPNFPHDQRAFKQSVFNNSR